MLHSTVTAADKRAAFRARLDAGELVRMPGAFNPLSAALIQDKGFEGVYISGAVLSADLGLPDIGLTTLTEVGQRGGQIARVTDLPTLIDADTGFGEPMNVARTVQVLEDAGISGMHLEDQVNPKRCGHLDGKEVVDEATAVKRIRAAVAGSSRPELPHHGAHRHPRCRRAPGGDRPREGAAGRRGGRDLPRGDGLSGGVRRRAGRGERADPGQHDRVRQERAVHYAAARGRRREHRDLPGVPAPARDGAAERGLEAILAEGSLTSKVPEMQTRARLYELLDYESYSTFDSGIFTFDLDNNRSGA